MNARDEEEEGGFPSLSSPGRWRDRRWDCWGGGVWDAGAGTVEKIKIGVILHYHSSENNHGFSCHYDIMHVITEI